MQNDLQLILLIFGVVVGVYLIIKALSRPNKKNEKVNGAIQQKQQEEDPLLDDYAELDNFKKNPMRPAKQKVTPAQELVENNNSHEILNSPAPVKEKPASTVLAENFIAISILPKRVNNPFIGYMLSIALKANHFFYGRQKLFHRHLQDDPSQPILFSVLSLTEPGFFNSSQMTQESYSGILLIMRLENLDNSHMVFEKMLTTAKQLAASLDGDLGDKHRKPLAPQLINEYRDALRHKELEVEKG